MSSVTLCVPKALLPSYHVYLILWHSLVLSLSPSIL